MSPDFRCYREAISNLEHLTKECGREPLQGRISATCERLVPSDSFFGLVYQAGTVKSYTINRVFPARNEDASSAQFSIAILHRDLALTRSTTLQAASDSISRGRKEKIQEAGTTLKRTNSKCPSAFGYIFHLVYLACY